MAPAVVLRNPGNAYSLINSGRVRPPRRPAVTDQGTGQGIYRRDAMTRLRLWIPSGQHVRPCPGHAVTDHRCREKRMRAEDSTVRGDPPPTDLSHEERRAYQQLIAATYS